MADGLLVVVRRSAGLNLRRFGLSAPVSSVPGGMSKLGSHVLAKVPLARQLMV